MVKAWVSTVARGSSMVVKMLIGIFVTLLPAWRYSSAHPTGYSGWSGYPRRPQTLTKASIRVNMLILGRNAFLRGGPHCRLAVRTSFIAIAAADRRAALTRAAVSSE